MEAVNLVKKQIQNGVTPHAYLFYGIDYYGKEEAINLLKNEFLGKFGVDFFEILPEEGIISIEQARFLKNLALRTSFGNKNIFLIRGLETLTREAEVALLKTLEDSSQNNLFIGTTENFNLLHPTIKSRFCSVRFFNESKELSGPTAKLDYEDSLEVLVRNSMLKWANELRKTFSEKYIYKLEKILQLNQLLPITALNRRMVKEYIEMLDAF